jgi:hypothetical protein
VPEIEYASMMRTEFRGQISAVQRQRLAALRGLKENGGHLSAWEARELALLERLNGTHTGPELSPDELAELAQLMKDTTLPQLGARSMSGREAVLRTLEMRWPKPRLSGRQAQLELLRLKAEWRLSLRQRQLARMKRP